MTKVMSDSVIFFCKRIYLQINNLLGNVRRPNSYHDNKRVIKTESITWNFKNFTCIITTLVKFDIYFLEIPWGIFFVCKYL